MTQTRCPRCGFARAHNGRCLRCGVFSPPPGANQRGRPRAPGRGQVPESGAAAATAPLRARIFKAARWTLFSLVCVIVFLVLRPADPPPVYRDPEAPHRLEKKLRRAGEAHAAAAEAVVRLDESELNAWMSSTVGVGPVEGPAATPAGSSRPDSASAGGGAEGRGAAGATGDGGAGGDLRVAVFDEAPADLTVEEVQSRVLDVRAHLISDQVVAYVLFDIYGKDLSLELQGRLSVQNGYLRFDPTALWIGSLPIPAKTVKRAVDRLFGDPRHRETFRVPPGVKDIRVEDSELVVVYQ
jgi:hypothetical protein